MPSQSNVTEGKKTASKRFAHEIHSNKPLLAALQATGNPERELSTAEKNQLKRRTAPPKNASPPRQLQILFSFLGEP